MSGSGDWYPMLLLETFRSLWSLFLAFFRSKPATTVLPLSSEGKTRAVGKLHFLSPPHQRGPIQRRGSSLAATRGRPAGSYARSNPHDLLPSNGYPQSRRGFSTYSLVLPDRHLGPPPRPPRISGSSISEDEFSTPVIISDDRLPSVIVTPCTPSTKAKRTYIGVDELDSDESSGSDASSSTSVDSNPFLSDPSPPLQKGIELPHPGLNNHHHRARSLTGTGRGLYYQRLSRNDHPIRGRLSSLPRVANPVKKSETPLLFGISLPGPSTSDTSFIRSSPNLNFISSQAITDQRIRSYMTKKSADQMLIQDVTVSASTRHSEDPEGSVTASGVAQPAAPAYGHAMITDRVTPSVHGHAQLGVVPYAEVFDLDAYFHSDSSMPSENTLKSSSNSSCSTTDSNESKNPFPIPATTAPATPKSPPSSIVFRNPLHRISNISDTTASSTSIYTYSLSAMSSDASSHSQGFGHGSLRIAENALGRKCKVTFDHEVKRYRDHYRPPAYSRSPAFVIESPTTSRKFTGRRESDGISIKGANKENEMAGSTASTDSIIISPQMENPSCPTMASLPVGHQQDFRRPFRSSDSSATMASLSPAGKNITTRHRLGSVAISQRRKM